MSNTGLPTKLGFKPVVMYFIRNYSINTRLIPVRNGKGERGPPSSNLSTTTTETLLIRNIILLD